MKKLLLNTLLLASFTSAYAADFTAGGDNPPWSLSLTQYIGDEYEAEFSYAHETRKIEIKTSLFKQYHPTFISYVGEASNGDEVSVVAIKKNCVRNGKTLSHEVIINDHFKGCGGKVVASTANRQNTQQKQKKAQQTQKKSPPVNPARAKAKQLNTKGYRLYKQGYLCNAIPYFDRARKADRSYVLAHYNLACSASLALATDCKDMDNGMYELEQYGNIETIISALKTATKLDPKHKAKSKIDPDLAYARKSYRYWHEILGYSAKNDAQFLTMLKNMEWEDEGGSYYYAGYQGEPAALIFKDNGKVLVRKARPFDNSGYQNPNKEYYSGKYRVHNGKVTLTFSRNGRRQVTRGYLIGKEEGFHGILLFKGAREANILPANRFSFHEPHIGEAF